MYIILSWSIVEHLNVELDPNTGETVIFDSEEEAEIYAQEEVNFNYKIVKIG